MGACCVKTPIKNEIFMENSKKTLTIGDTIDEKSIKIYESSSKRRSLLKIDNDEELKKNESELNHNAEKNIENLENIVKRKSLLKAESIDDLLKNGKKTLENPIKNNTNELNKIDNKKINENYENELNEKNLNEIINEKDILKIDKKSSEIIIKDEIKESILNEENKIKSIKKSKEIYDDQEKENIKLYHKEIKTKIVKGNSELFGKIPFNTFSDLSKEILDKLTKESSLEEDQAIMKKYPLISGWSRDGVNYQCCIWVPECGMSMKDFIDVNHIPLFDLKDETSFNTFCREHLWFNTANKFIEMWKSLHLNTARIIHSAIARFDVIIEISDCFVTNNGDYCRAYKILGHDRRSVFKTSSFITNSFIPQIGIEVKWHNDYLFQEDIYSEEEREYDKYNRSRNDGCGENLYQLQYGLYNKCTTNNSSNMSYSIKYSKKECFQKIQNNNNNNNNSIKKNIFRKLISRLSYFNFTNN